MNESLPSTPLHILLKEGNQHALTVLNRNYAEGLFRALRPHRYFVNVADFHDIFNDSLLRIWEKRHSFDSTTDVEKMLMHITKAFAIDRLRKLNTQAGRLLTGVEPDELVADQLEEKIPVHDMPVLQAKLNLFRSALDQLAEKQREIIEALWFEGVSISDLAKRLGVKYSTIANTNDQALKKMQRYLIQNGLTADMIEPLAQLMPLLALLFSTFLKNI